MPEPKPHPEKPKARKGKDANDQGNADAATKKKLDRFQMRDRNSDGIIDRIEFEATAVVKEAAAIQTRFSKMDADGDGKITQDEFLTAVQ